MCSEVRERTRLSRCVRVLFTPLICERVNTTERWRKMLLNRKLSKQSPPYILLRFFFFTHSHSLLLLGKVMSMCERMCVSLSARSLRDVETINNGKVITRQTTYIANIFSVTDTVRPKTANEQNRNYYDRNMSALLSCFKQHASTHACTHIHTFACTFSCLMHTWPLIQ